MRHIPQPLTGPLTTVLTLALLLALFLGFLAVFAWFLGGRSHLKKRDVLVALVVVLAGYAVIAAANDGHVDVGIHLGIPTSTQPP